MNWEARYLLSIRSRWCSSVHVFRSHNASFPFSLYLFVSCGLWGDDTFFLNGLSPSDDPFPLWCPHIRCFALLRLGFFLCCCQAIRRFISTLLYIDVVWGSRGAIGGYHDHYRIFDSHISRSSNLRLMLILTIPLHYYRRELSYFSLNSWQGNVRNRDTIDIYRSLVKDRVRDNIKDEN